MQIHKTAKNICKYIDKFFSLENEKNLIMLNKTTDIKTEEKEPVTIANANEKPKPEHYENMTRNIPHNHIKWFLWNSILQSAFTKNELKKIADSVGIRTKNKDNKETISRYIVDRLFHQENKFYRFNQKLNLSLQITINIEKTLDI